METKMSVVERQQGWSREEAAAVGMVLAWHAECVGAEPAIISEQGNRTFAELNARANALVRALRRRGLKAGDAVALMCSNRPEFVEVVAACQRGGFRMTPVNWHLKATEIGYIVDNCEAKAFVSDARFAGPSKEAAALAPGIIAPLAVGGAIDGFEDYEAAVSAEAGHNIEDAVAGTQMMYSSGTSGHSKGVYRKAAAPVSPLR